MQIKLHNLGPLSDAVFELGDLTMICGMNNTGKTYATYAFYGFLEYWSDTYAPSIPSSLFESLYQNGKAIVDLEDYARRWREELDRASREYSETLNDVFASRKERFDGSSFHATLEAIPDSRFTFPEAVVRSRTRNIFEIRQVGVGHLEVSLLVDGTNNELIPPKSFIEHRIADAIKIAVYGDLIPRCYIASTERTGAAIFRKALEKARVFLNSDTDVEVPASYREWRLLQDFKYGYALPVQRNIEFNWRLDEITKRDSFLVTEGKALLRDFSDLLGGTYHIVNDEPYFVPSGSVDTRLTMDESSSAVRSLLDVGLYLRHVARPGDLLMIDEPELNLHPENQRRIARLMASLVNLGIKVFITTHSDYIIKELNTLIMLHARQGNQRGFMQTHGYTESELIAASKIKVYATKPISRSLSPELVYRAAYTFESASVSDDIGIVLDSFDDTIDKMNYLQQEVLFGGDEGM